MQRKLSIIFKIGMPVLILGALIVLLVLWPKRADGADGEHEVAEEGSVQAPRIMVTAGSRPLHYESS